VYGVCGVLKFVVGWSEWRGQICAASSEGMIEALLSSLQNFIISGLPTNRGHNLSVASTMRAPLAPPIPHMLHTRIWVARARASGCSSSSVATTQNGLCGSGDRVMKGMIFLTRLMLRVDWASARSTMASSLRRRRRRKCVHIEEDSPGDDDDEDDDAFQFPSMNMTSGEEGRDSVVPFVQRKASHRLSKTIDHRRP